MTRAVRYTPPMPPLFPVWDAATGEYLAALLSEANRAEYVARNKYEHVE